MKIQVSKVELQMRASLKVKVTDKRERFLCLWLSPKM